MLRQTMVFGGIALIISVLFLFLVLPGFISLINSMLSTNPFEATDTIPPQPPRVIVPFDATTESRIELIGDGESGSNLTLLLNSRQVGETTIAEDRTFKLTVTLQEGENVIEAYATDAAGNESALSRRQIIYLDTTKPFIDLDNLENGQEIIGKDKENFRISGKTEPRANMLINDRSVYVNSDGSFSTQIRLEEGENDLDFRATDQAGNTAELELKVRFRY